jgi:hypothetical protein
MLDSPFSCTDAVPCVLRACEWLVAGDWIKTSGAKNIESARPAQSDAVSISAASSIPKLLAVLAAGVALGMALARSR